MFISWYTNLKNYWYENGWSLIFYISILALFVLWCLRGWFKIKPSSDIEGVNLLQAFFRPTTVPTTIIRKPAFSFSPPQKQKISKGEDECKKFMEYYFGKPFSNTRPDFLKNPITNSNLELDVYNDELRIAVEYNGSQHYHFNSMMHGNSKDKFQNQQYRDYIKKNLCKEKGIDLIIVPYTVPKEKIGDFLYEELKSRGYSPLS